MSLMSPNNLSDIQDVSPFIGLPPEIWDRIAGKLDKKTLDAATRASHLFRRLLIRPLFYKARLEAPHEQLSSKLQHILKSDLACRNLLDPKKYVHQLWIEVLPPKEPEPGNEAAALTLPTEPQDFERDLPGQVVSLLCCLPNLITLGIALKGFSKHQNAEFARTISEIAPLKIMELFATLTDVAATSILQACPRLRQHDSGSSNRSVQTCSTPIIGQLMKSQPKLRRLDVGHNPGSGSDIDDSSGDDDEPERTTTMFINPTIIRCVLKTFRDLQWLSICENLPYKPDPWHGWEEFHSSIKNLTAILAEHKDLRGLRIELRHETAWELVRCDTRLEKEDFGDKKSTILDNYYTDVLEEVMERLPYVEQLSIWARDANLCYQLRRSLSGVKSFIVNTDSSGGMKLTHGIHPYALFGYPVP